MFLCLVVFSVLSLVNSLFPSTSTFVSTTWSLHYRAPKPASIATSISITTSTATSLFCGASSTKTIFGDRIISCRDFSIHSPKQIELLGNYVNMSSMPEFNLPEIGLFGRSNVGKSSLLNALLTRSKKKSTVIVTSRTPGCTRALRPLKCSDNKGAICIFTDLPGYGYAKMSKSAQERSSNILQDYLLNGRCLRLVLLLIDSRRAWEDTISDFDVQAMNMIRREGLPSEIVLTKCDLLKKQDLMSAENELKNWHNATTPSNNAEAESMLTVADGSSATIGFKSPLLRNIYRRFQRVPFLHAATTGYGSIPVWHAIKSGLRSVDNEYLSDDYSSDE